MAEIKILNEHQITIYPLPDKPTLQQVITYQVAGMAPRTIWIDADQLPDIAYTIKNPGKPIPKDTQALGDAVRRTAIEAEHKKITAQPKARSI